MRTVITALLAAMLFWIAGCGEARHPSVPGPITEAPPAAAGVSTTTEGLITYHANAVATGNKPAAKAATVAIHDQDTEQGIGGLRWLMLAGVVVAAVGIGAWAEFGKLIGGGILATGAALGVMSLIFAPLWAHRELIALVVVAAGLLYEAYRHRAQFVKAGHSVAALEHTMLTTGQRAVSHAVPAVEKVLAHSWAKVHGESMAVLSKLHFASRLQQMPGLPTKPNPAVPAAPAPAAPVPAPAPAAPLTP